MCILFEQLVDNTRFGKMLTGIKFIFLFVLQCVMVDVSLLIPLAQPDAVSTSKANNLMVPESIEQITPNTLKVTDLIQQIDVKDVANQVISNINDVVVGVESKDTLIPGLLNQLANETQANNTSINEINTVSNGTEVNGNVTSNLVLNATKNVASLNNNVSTDLTETTILIENVGSGAANLPLTLKPASVSRNTIIDVKFRRSGSQNQENSTDDINKDAAANNSFLESSLADNATVANSNNTDDVEHPAFRMLLQDKLRKLKQVSNIVTESVENKDHNLVLKLLPETPPLTIDINQLPLNNLIGGAFSFIKRLKRHADEKQADSLKSNCKFKQIDDHKMLSRKETKDLTVSTNTSLDDNISKILKLYNSDDLLCPLSVAVKLYAQHVLDLIIKSNPDGLLNQILTSFMRGNEGTINLVSKELPFLPIPVNLRLQLVHGKTKEFVEQLSDIIDAILCAL